MSEPSDTPFRVYVLDEDRDATFLGAADDSSLGGLLITLRRQGKAPAGTKVGILYRPDDAVAGEWLVNPWL